MSQNLKKKIHWLYIRTNAQELSESLFSVLSGNKWTLRHFKVGFKHSEYISEMNTLLSAMSYKEKWDTERQRSISWWGTRKHRQDWRGRALQIAGWPGVQTWWCCHSSLHFLYVWKSFKYLANESVQRFQDLQREMSFDWELLGRLPRGGNWCKQERNQTLP